MSVQAILEGLVDLGISVEDIQEAAEALEAPKGKKGGKGKKEDADEEKGGKGKKGGKDKKGPSVDDLITDLSDEDVLAVVVHLELVTEKKGKKLDREELVELMADSDAADVEEAIGEVVSDVDYEDMSTDDLIDLYVEREIGTKKAAKKLTDEELVEALEENDED